MAGRKPEGTLRKGWTTGACAAAAATAAFEAIQTGSFPDPVVIRLPQGLEPSFQLSRSQKTEHGALAGVVKDAGDDPDVTDGAEIIVELTAGEPGSGIQFRAGDGVGTVTLPGLPLAVGEPAINPAPRRIIGENLETASMRLGGDLDYVLTISIPGGQSMAEKTMNGRLGIKGGLSVLGTTGIVIPYSCASWIHSIYRGVDVALANGFTHIAAATGSTSEAAVRRIYDLPDVAIIDMGDFAGGLLKYLRSHPVGRLTLAGGFAKLVKLAQGNMDLHSSRSSVDFARLAAAMEALGASAETTEQARTANTAMEVLELARQSEIALADHIAAGAREVGMATIAGGVELEVMVFDRAGNRVGHAG